MENNFKEVVKKEVSNDITKTNTKTKRNKPKAKSNNSFKIEQCKVLKFNKKEKALDIDFKGYGVRLYDVDCDIKEYVEVKYCGEIGKPDFIVKL